TIATLAVTEPGGRSDAEGIAAVARRSGDGFVLDGTKSYVLDGMLASLLVVVARLEGTTGEAGISFLAVAPDADGVTRRALSTLDLTRKQAHVDLLGAPGVPIGTPGDGWPALVATLAEASAALANESMGGAQMTLESAVEYGRSRIQFGRPIGS